MRSCTRWRNLEASRRQDGPAPGRDPPRERCEHALIELDATARLSHGEIPRLEPEIRQRLAHWRGMLRREVPEAREILRRPGPEDLYDVINERYEKASIVLTSNRDRSEWPELFGEALLASAALDRLTHGAHFVEITDPNFRAEHTKKQLTTQRRGKNGS